MSNKHVKNNVYKIQNIIYISKYVSKNRIIASNKDWYSNTIVQGVYL
jgi:hypothetical protein